MKAQAIGSEATSGNDRILHWRQRISVVSGANAEVSKRIASIPSHRSSVYCALCVLSEQTTHTINLIPAQFIIKIQHK